MRSFFNLYKKELKQIRMALVFLLFLYSGVILYSLFINGGHLKKVNFFSMTIILIMVGSVWLGPVIFAYSLNDEWKRRTNHQLFSLPVRRFKLIITKYLTALTLCIITSIGTSVCMYLTGFLMPSQNLANRHMFIYFRTLQIFSNVSWVLGIACATVGVMFFFQRFRSIIGVSSFFSLCYISVYIVESFYPIWIGQIYQHFAWIIIGFVFMLLGLFLFEKYSEV